MQIFKNHKEEKCSMRITPEFVSSLKENEIFVFGCRRSGRHWEGAAAYALEHFGAVYGQSKGRQGQAYAIATAGVDLTEIRKSVGEFLEYAKMPTVKLEVQQNPALLRSRSIAPRAKEGGKIAKSDQQYKKNERETTVSLKRISYFCIANMYKHLTREQRYAIYLGQQKGETLEIIAHSIGVHKSTVSREMRRNATPRGKYVWNKAHDTACSRKERYPGNRALTPVLKWRVIDLIKEKQWSPRQISGRLAKEGINISHETIYAIIRADVTGELASNCRHKMKYRRSSAKRHETKATNIRNRVSIHEGPAEADGKRFGDWEMDLIVDKDSNAILTLVERSTNFLLMEKLKHGKRAKPLARVVWRLLLPYKGDALKTITTDNGSEFAEHEWITRKLNVPVFFADSYSSWQKGAVENENKLVRQYIPKGTDISTITDGKIRMIRMRINARPREKLNFSTPTEAFFKNIS